MTLTSTSLPRRAWLKRLPAYCGVFGLFGVVGTAGVRGSIAVAATPPSSPSPMLPSEEDPYLWLEDVQGERALGWVRERNRESHVVLTAEPGFATLEARLLDVLNASDRIPAVTRRGDWFYNLWQDEAHPRGLWRRTLLADYRKATPEWDLVLDLDALGKAEGENWVWGGASALGPDYRHFLVSLSRGGADATVVREFDAQTKRFVDAGYSLPEAKSSIVWLDVDTVYVATDFGPGTLTDSGYPRVIKRWRRGTPLTDAVTVFEGETRDVSVSVSVDRTPNFERTIFVRAVDFFHSHTFLLRGEQRVRLDIPDDASIDFMRETMLIHLRSPLQVGDHTWPAGSLLHIDAEAYLAGDRALQALFTPTPTRSLDSYVLTREHVVLNVMDQVASRLEEWARGPKGFTRRAIAAPSPGTLSVGSLHDPLLATDALAERYMVSYTDFLTPDTLFLGRTGSDERELLKSRGALFDASDLQSAQHFATSKDGTRIPYFVVSTKGAKKNGKNPTLLYGYGGFEISLNPFYSGGFGRAWYEDGGVLVVANIRGGGEFGPDWHQSAIKAHKQRSYDDFIAVAEDLIKTGITSPEHLGIEGGSNGGLLVGATFVQRPDLFNAVVCKVPLLDMKRYSKLLAGASWMAEYGDPDDPAEWAYISRYSPYQNIAAKSATTYPKVFFTTSTRDDRVHPGHARKMAARMMEQGHDLLYYENIEGGHGGAADNAQRAHLQALEFTYLWQQLGG